MKSIILLVSILALSSVITCGLGDHWPLCLYPQTFHSDMKVNEFDVDLSKYAGEWHEQYHILPSFIPQQKFCVCTQVKYTLNEKGEIKVQNRCANTDKNLKWGGIDGHLVVNDKPHNKKGAVYFFEDYIGRHTIPYLTGSYWILDLDPDYQWALVGEPCKQSAYFLTRERKGDQAIINKSLNDLKEKWKYTTFSDLAMTDQDTCPDFPGYDETGNDPVGDVSLSSKRFLEFVMKEMN